jgi:hypothetical protein
MSNKKRLLKMKQKVKGLSTDLSTNLVDGETHQKLKKEFDQEGVIQVLVHTAANVVE